MTTLGGASAHDVTIEGLLASPVFGASRRAAKRLSSSPAGLRALMRDVETKQFAGWVAADSAERVYLDIACAVLEARVEELETQPTATPTPTPTTTQAQPTTQTPTTRQAPAGPQPAVSTARLELFVATLHYFVTSDDELPDHQLTGHVDDLMLLRWVVTIAQRELPAS